MFTAELVTCMFSLSQPVGKHVTRRRAEPNVYREVYVIEPSGQRSTTGEDL